jgi:hypothetical protein
MGSLGTWVRFWLRTDRIVDSLLQQGFRRKCLLDDGDGRARRIN